MRRLHLTGYHMHRAVRQLINWRIVTQIGFGALVGLLIVLLAGL